MQSDKIEEKISCKGISSNSNRDVVYPYLDMIVDTDIPHSNITMCYWQEAIVVGDKEIHRFKFEISTTRLDTLKRRPTAIDLIFLFYNSVHWKLTPLFFVQSQMSDGKFRNVSDIHWFASFIFVDFVCHFISILLLHSVLFETNSRKGIFLSLFVTDLKS